MKVDLPKVMSYEVGSQSITQIQGIEQSQDRTLLQAIKSETMITEIAYSYFILSAIRSDWSNSGYATTSLVSLFQALPLLFFSNPFALCFKSTKMEKRDVISRQH